MSKRKSGFNTPIGEIADVAKEVVGEVGQVVRGHQDSKTKRHIADNNAGVEHHKIQSGDLGQAFDFIIRGVDTIIGGINDFRQISTERDIALEQEKTKRDQALKDLEKAKASFQLAREQAVMHHETWCSVYQTAVSESRSAWDRLFDLLQSDSVSEKERERLQTQMADLQRHIKEVTVSFFEQDSDR